MTQRLFPSKRAMTDYYRDLKDRNLLEGSITDATRKREHRAARKPRIPPRPGRILALQGLKREPVIVPLGKLGRIDAVRKRDRRKLWTSEEAGFLNSLWEKGSNSDWKKRSTFQRYLVTQSVAVIIGYAVVYTYDGMTYRIKAPRGYKWTKDMNGVALVGKAGDYHPTGSELVEASRDKSKSLVAAIKEYAAKRKAQEAKAKQQLQMLKRAEREGAMLCLADSLKAGNCQAGTESWAKLHRLDPRKHYKPSQVLPLANGDTRVALVAAQAVRRHRLEMERGYCELSAHRI